MRAQADPFAGILGELGVLGPRGTRVPAKANVMGADAAEDDLVDAAKALVQASPPPTDYLGQLLASHATQIAEEKARVQAAEQDHHRTKALIGWGVAGALAAAVLYLLGRRK